jgi:uncharacterized SAM-binding protein YcdF (DUF218 family)
MSSFRARAAADAIVVCCSYDLRVCDYACELLRQGLAPTLLLSGKSGNWTKFLWTETEARVFHARALLNGVDPQQLVLEEQATNFGENIAFARKLLPAARRVIFLTKPPSVLRVSVTVPIQWPEVSAFVDSPLLKFPEEVSQVIGVFGIIQEMVGDIDRVRRYPAKGFQVPHALPNEVLQAYEALIADGFSQHMLRAE